MYHSTSQIVSNWSMTRLVVVNKTNTPRLTADGSFDKFSQKTQADAFVGGDRDVGTKD